MSYRKRSNLSLRSTDMIDGKEFANLGGDPTSPLSPLKISLIAGAAVLLAAGGFVGYKTLNKPNGDNDTPYATNVTGFVAAGTVYCDKVKNVDTKKTYNLRTVLPEGCKLVSAETAVVVLEAYPDGRAAVRESEGGKDMFTDASRIQTNCNVGYQGGDGIEFFPLTKLRSQSCEQIAAKMDAIIANDAQAQAEAETAANLTLAMANTAAWQAKVDTANGNLNSVWAEFRTAGAADPAWFNEVLRIQRAWLKEREAICKARGLAEGDVAPARSFELKCQFEMTEAKVTDLLTDLEAVMDERRARERAPAFDPNALG